MDVWQRAWLAMVVVEDDIFPEQCTVERRVWLAGEDKNRGLERALKGGGYGLL